MFPHTPPLLLAISLAIPVGACGSSSSNECLDLSTTEPPAGPLTSAADFDTSACDPASLEGLEIAGSFEARGLVRLDPSCERGYDVKGMRFADTDVPTYVHRDESGLLVRRAVDDFVVSMLICGAEPGSNGDAFYGQIGFCVPGDGGELECFERAVSVDRFGRIGGEAEAEGLELVAEYKGEPGSPWPDDFVGNVEVVGDTLFITNNGDAVYIIDVSDPAAPVELGRVDAGDNWNNDIEIFEVAGRRYIALAGDNEVPIVDVTDPSAPERVAAIAEPAHRIELAFPNLYIAGAEDLPIYDLSDPTAPVKVGVFAAQAQGGIHAAVADGDRLYIAGGFSGFWVVDPLPDPAAASVLGRYTEDGRQYSHHAGIFEVDGTTYALHGDEVGDEPWFKIIDVTPGSDTFMQVRGEYLTRESVPSHNITMDGTRAYVAYYHDGVRVLDLSDPTAPRLEAYFNTWQAETAPHSNFEGATDIAIDRDRGLVFASDDPRGLLILRER